MSGRPLPDLSDEVMDAVRTMWTAGATRAEVLDFAGVSAGRLFDRGAAARGKGRPAHWSLTDNPLPSRQGLGGGRRSGEDFIPQDPTPAEIAQACASIRATWTRDERNERKFVGAPDLTAWRNRGDEADLGRRERLHQGGSSCDPRRRPF